MAAKWKRTPRIRLVTQSQLVVLTVLTDHNAAPTDSVSPILFLAASSIASLT